MLNIIIMYSTVVLYICTMDSIMHNCKHNTSKEKILEQACKLFAQKGYEKTTIREICKAANTYPVSVNYYFGSKDKLFIETFKYAFSIAGEEDLAIKIKNLAPEEKFKAIIKIAMQMSFSEDKKGWFYKIISRCEGIMHQEPFLQEFFQFKQFHKNLIQTTLKEIFNDNVSIEILDYAYFNLISQIIVLNNKNTNLKDLFITDYSDEDQLENLTNLIYDFVVSGTKQLIKENNTVGDNKL